MLRRISLTLSACTFICCIQCAPSPSSEPETSVTEPEPSPQVTIETTEGTIVIELFTNLAPQCVANFQEYVSQGYYDHTIFSAVEPGSWIIGGRYTEDLVENDSQPLANESDNGLTNIRGRVALYAAVGEDFDPETDEIEPGVPDFLINVTDNSSLNYDPTTGALVPFTVIGRVIEGMGVAMTISRQPTSVQITANGSQLESAPTTPVVIIQVYNGGPDDQPAAEDNQSPIADAGKDRNIVPGLMVTLDGSGSSDPNKGDKLVYAWEQTAGVDVNLYNSTSNQTYFEVPQEADQLSFTLTVDDTRGGTATASVTLTVVEDLQVRLTTSLGDIVLDMLGDQSEAPKTTLNFLQYVEDGFYDGTIFHRVAPSFVVQGGGYEPGLVKKETRDAIENEFDSSRSNVRGTVAMAKTGDDPDSATSQFFFNLADNSANLDEQNEGFTVFAQVVEGMEEVVDVMAQVETSTQQDPDGNTFTNVPVEDIILISATLEEGKADEEEEEDTDDEESQENEPPTAKAGSNQTVIAGGRVSLDASRSSDPDEGDTLSYSWLQTSGPSVELSDPAGDKPTFTAGQEEATLTFQLTVTDDNGESATALVTVTVKAFDLADPVNYAVGSSPSAVIAADLNGDGELDLAVANESSDNVSVLLQEEDGTFAAAVNYAVSSAPVSMISGDLDSDGDVDLVSANRGSGTISVLLNDGEGVFSSATDFTVGDSPVSISASDFDKDGALDLAVANLESDNITVLLNDGDATFNRKENVDTTPKPENEITEVPETNGVRWVSAGDLDNDGDSDLATANQDSNNVSILLNGGTGVLEAKLAVATDGRPVFVLADDFNGDGNSDLAAVRAEANGISVWRNNGDATFSFPATPTVGTGPVALVAADFDDDGDIDLAVANKDSDNISILLNKGTGTFAAAKSFDAGDGPSSVVTGDFNGDGDIDLAVANSVSNNISVLLNAWRGLEPGDEEESDGGGFITTDSGLQYKDVVKGTGSLVTMDSTISVLYTGRLDDENGEIFDSTADGEPREFALTGLIEGWQEGLTNYDMREGGTRILIIPPDLAYGEAGYSPSIPGNATLYFEIEVLEIVE